MSTTIAINDASLLGGLSRYNWYRNGSTSLTSVNPGAYLKFNFTGTSLAVVVDMTAVNATGTGAGAYPVIAYTVDGVRATRQLLSTDTSITLATGLADTTHTFRLDFIGTDESGNTDRWTTPSMALVITSFTVDTGKAVTQATLRNGGWMLVYGDSITEGAVTLGAANNPPYYAQVEDATTGWQQIVADHLNVEYGNCAFAGQQWSSTGASNVPGLATSYNLLFSGQSRTFSPAPNLALINMGTNGSVTAGTVTTFLGNLRTAVGAGCQITLVIPFGQLNVTAITDGFDDYVTANPTDLRVNLIDLGSAGSSIVSAHSYDTVHPDATGQALLAAAVIPSLVYPLTAGNPNPAALAGVL